MTGCPKCGSPWRRVYPNDEIKELDEKTQYKLAKQVICTKRECSFQWELSPIEIIRHFFDLRRMQGISEKQALDELREETKKARWGQLQ